MFNRDDGETIAKKLSAKVEPGRKHDQVVVWMDGRRVGQFGLRRSSKDAAHSYIPRQLHISPRECRELCDCSLSAEQYFDLLRERRSTG